MGLYVHSLSRLPFGSERDYYVYVLDYGWHEPLGDALRGNFPHMADLAARNDAALIERIFRDIAAKKPALEFRNCQRD